MTEKAPKSSSLSAQWLLYLSIVILVAVSYSGYYFFQIKNPPHAQYGRLPSAASPLANHIALLDAQQRVWVADPTTGNRYLLSDESLRCGYPTWSPDGAYIGYTATDSSGHTSIYVSAVNGGEHSRLVYIGGYSPTCFSWSPNSRALVFRFNNGTSLWGQVVSLDAVERAFSFEYHRSLFWQWSDAGKYILWNRDGHVNVTGVLSPTIHADPEQSPSRFRAPLWSSSDGNFIFTGQYQGHRSLLEYAGASKAPRPVYPTSGQASIVISPDYARIAILNYRRASSGILSILTRAQGKELQLTRARAAFWSPDSRYLAFWSRGRFLTSNSGNVPGDRHILTQATARNSDSYRWWIFDTEENSSFPLVSFIPTKACIDMTWHFSQYHASHTFWSPDSQYFLVPSIDPETNEARVWKVDIQGEKAAVDLGEGTFATWSWQ